MLARIEEPNYDLESKLRRQTNKKSLKRFRSESDGGGLLLPGWFCWSLGSKGYAFWCQNSKNFV